MASKRAGSAAGAAPRMPPNVRLCEHPVLKHKLTKMRDKHTDAVLFRNLMREITFFLGCARARAAAARGARSTPTRAQQRRDEGPGAGAPEVLGARALQSRACRYTFSVVGVCISECRARPQSPMGDGVGHHIKSRVALVPVLRAGLGMAEAMLDLVPTARVHHIGARRAAAAPAVSAA